MSAAARWQALAAIDARSILRDPMLRWIVLLTPLFGLLFRYATPAVTTALQARLGFDLQPYYPLMMSFLPLVVAGMNGVVVGFLLLDQRDDRTLTALLVTPLSLADYLRYRLTMLMLLGAMLTMLTVVLAGLTPVSPLQLLMTSVVAAPLAPLYALFLASFAHNKVQGFALAKALGLVVVPCIIAWFVTGPWQLAFGLLPQFWSMKVFWLFDAGTPGAALVHAAVGLAWQALLLVLLSRRLGRVLRR